MSRLKTNWTNNRDLFEIKQKMKGLKPTDQLVIVTPGYKLKDLRSLGFVVHKVIVKNEFDDHGYFKTAGEMPTYYRVIRIRSQEDLNFLKLSHPKAIWNCYTVEDIVCF